MMQLRFFAAQRMEYENENRSRLPRVAQLER